MISASLATACTWKFVVEGHKRTQQDRWTWGKGKGYQGIYVIRKCTSEETSAKRASASSGNALLKKHQQKGICVIVKCTSKETSANFKRASVSSGNVLLKIHMKKSISVISKCTSEETSAKRASASSWNVLLNINQKGISIIRKCTKRAPASSDKFWNPFAGSPGIERERYSAQVGHRRTWQERRVHPT